MTYRTENIEDGISAYLTKDGKRRYWVRVKDRHGYWYPRRSFERLVEARAHRDELKGGRARGQAAIVAQARKISLTAYYPRWAGECRQGVSEGWRVDQDRLFARYIEPTLGRAKVADIRPQDIGRVVDEVLARGLSAQSALHVYTVLHKMFEDAIEHFELLASNPVLKRYRPKLTKTERTYLRPEEVATLLQASNGHYLSTPIWIAALAGLRPSEVQALCWDAIEFEPPQLVIKAAYKRKVRRIEPYPKGKAWGRVALPPELVQHLRQRAVGAARDAFVAPGHDGCMLKYEAFLKGLRSMCKRAGVPMVTPHELRHSATEIWVRAGASREDISRVLNQSSQAVVDRYMHRTDERTARIASLIQLPAPATAAADQKPKLRLVGR